MRGAFLFSAPEENMPIHYKRTDDYLVLLGHTYPFRDLIKQLGGYFDAKKKVWLILYNEALEKKVHRLCEDSGGSFLGDQGIHKKPQEDTAISEQLISFYPQKQTRKSHTVTSLLKTVSDQVKNLFPYKFWVRGEVHNLALKPYAIYFSLEEKQENLSSSLVLPVVVWSQQIQTIQEKHAIRLAEFLQEGLEILIEGYLHFYQERAQLSFFIYDLDMDFTLGSFALQRQKVIQELKFLGLYSLNKQKTLPRWIMKIGLITAEGSRAYSDFIDQLVLYGYFGEVLFSPAKMQGTDAPQSIIDELNELKNFDCDMVVIIRGGGEQADLRCFDDKELAISVAKYPVPILAAIGHHEDQSIVEDICFQREKTPTAAADFFCHHQTQAQDSLKSYQHHLLVKSRECLANQQLHIEKQKNQLYRYSIRLLSSYQEELNKKYCFLQTKSGDISISIEKFIIESKYLFRKKISENNQNWQRSLDTRKLKLEHLDPRKLLKKGYTKLQTQRGSTLTSINQLEADSIITAYLLDGKVYMKTIRIKKK